MRNARGKISVDIMLVTGPVTLNGKDLVEGDYIVSDGRITWGLSKEHAHAVIQPSGDAARKLLGIK